MGEGGRASDEIEGLRFEVKWEATKGALGIWVNPEDVQIKDSELVVVRHISISSLFLT